MKFSQGIFLSALVLLVICSVLAGTANILPPHNNDPELETLLKQARLHSARSSRKPATGHPELLSEAEQKANNITTLEGDMDIGDGSALPSGYQDPNAPSGLFADVIADKNLRWPNSRVPYEIDERFTPTQKLIIKRAIKAFHKETCVRFVPKTKDDVNYLYIRHVTVGCYAKLGYTNLPRQWVSFSDHCFDEFGRIIHELMHSLGFFHTQSRTDRDNYITIDFDKVQPSLMNNFQKMTDAEIDDQGQPYDFGSLMHYPKDAFSKKRNQITIEPKVPLPDGVEMGQRIYFSELDIKKINILYSCKGAIICNADEVKCGGNENSKCGKKCDGIAQCSDGSDERNCPKPVCATSSLWACDTVKCILPSWLCDGTRDCPNGEDEKPANCKSRKCASTDLDCGKCVPAIHVCDGVLHCVNGQDEEVAMCNKKRKEQLQLASRQQQQQPQQFNHYQQPNYLPYLFGLQQGFGSFFNPFAFGPFGFDTSNTTQRNCFFDVESLHQQPAIRLTPEIMKSLLFEANERFCNVISLGFAQIDPKSFQVSFGGSKEGEILQLLSEAKDGHQILGFAVVIGSADAESPAIQTLRTIGSDIGKSNKFAVQLVTTLRKWNATGLALQWLKPQLSDQAAFTGLIRALAQALQYDPSLREKSQQDEKKVRLQLSVNVVPKIQPGQNQQFILENVDSVNVIPDRDETRKSKLTKYTNELLSSLATGKKALHSNTWLIEDGSKKKYFLKRINIGVEFAPLSWTVNISAIRNENSRIAGEQVRSLGLPGPLSGTVGMLNAGEICLLNKPQSRSAKSNSAFTYNITTDSTKAGGGAPYAYNSRGQWIAYETPESLAAKLKAADLTRFGGMYVVDAHNDDVRGVCGKQQEQYGLLTALAKTVEPGAR